jgi:hypothetical protein
MIRSGGKSRLRDKGGLHPFAASHQFRIQSNAKTETKMKNIPFSTSAHRFRAATAAIALIAFAQLGIVSQMHAAANPVSVQTAELHALLVAVHDLTSYNGDEQTAVEHLAAWEELWADDATLSVNGGAPMNREAITAFWVGSGPFNFNWVGLTPSFRSEISVEGNTAEVYLECIFLDETKTVRAERALWGTVRKSGGKWLFWKMSNTGAASLF